MSSAGSLERVIGRYALYGALASGGMATVHLGRLLGPVGFSRTVAIKRLHEHYARDPEFVTMFLDEARIAARIRHPNVVQTLDVVATEEQLFLVMDYVQGETLARLLRTVDAAHDLVPPHIAVGIMTGTLHGLHAAHEARNERGDALSIVHRDVSPQNIMVGIDGVARVLDFGVAKAVGRLHSTREGQLKGKIAYMAPEQLRYDEVDRRTDVYAASVVLWETLVGQRLFTASNEGAVIDRVLKATVAPPSAIVPDLPAAVDAVVMRGLHRDPDKRYATAREMALELEAAMAPATAVQLGVWVESVARGALEARAARVAEVESTERHGADETTVADAPHTEPSMSSGVVGVPSSRRGGVLPIVAVVAIAGVSIFGVVRATSPRAPSLEVSTLTQPTTTAVLVGSAAPPPVTAPPASDLPVASTATTVVPSPPASIPPAAAVRRAHPTASASAPDCTHPFTWDAMGRKLYKKECLE